MKMVIIKMASEQLKCFFQIFKLLLHSCCCIIYTVPNRIHLMSLEFENDSAPKCKPYLDEEREIFYAPNSILAFRLVGTSAYPSSRTPKVIF